MTRLIMPSVRAGAGVAVVLVIWREWPCMRPAILSALCAVVAYELTR